MRQSLRIIAVCMAGLLCFAWDAMSQWHITYDEGDKMLDKPGYYVCTYQDLVSRDGGGYTTNGTMWFAIFTNKDSIFDYKDEGIKVVDVVVGYYVDGELVDREKRITYVTEPGNFVVIHSETSKRIRAHLRGKGDVRIYARKYPEGRYDVTFPMDKRLK